MGIEELKNRLRNMQEEIDAKNCPIECWLFGSMLAMPDISKDIDLLILYDNNITLNMAKTLFEPIQAVWPIDLLFLQPEEERQFNFIQTRKAIRIF